MSRRKQIIAWLSAGLVAVALTLIAWQLTPPHAAWKQGHTYARLASPGSLTPAHASLAGDCEACHEPGDGPTAVRCKSCHVVEQTLMDRPETRFHADIDTCASCHPEHGEPTTVHPELLHVRLAEVGARTRGLDAESAAPETMLACASCHGASEPHAGYLGDECSSCHTTATWRVQGYTHPADQTGHCGECHKPPPNHFNPMFEAQCTAMLGHTGGVERCDGCHTTIGWDFIRSASWHRDTMSHRARR